jgi:hypothetical protein
VVNFINFTFSALLAPVFSRLLQRVSGGAEGITHEQYQGAFVYFIYGVGIAVVLSFFLRETGAKGLNGSRS